MQQLQIPVGARHTTVSVDVPSSEHVAEIVGRQGNLMRLTYKIFYQEFCVTI